MGTERTTEKRQDIEKRQRKNHLTQTALVCLGIKDRRR